MTYALIQIVKSYGVTAIDLSVAVFSKYRLSYFLQATSIPSKQKFSTFPSVLNQVKKEPLPSKIPGLLKYCEILLHINIVFFAQSCIYFILLP